jgi:hypothetical protein
MLNTKYATKYKTRRNFPCFSSKIVKYMRGGGPPGRTGAGLAGGMLLTG